MSVESVLNEARARIGNDGTESWTHVGHSPEAWCADFLCLVFDMGGEDCQHSASAAGFASQFDSVDDADVRAGDVVFFGWDGIREVYFRDQSHVAIVEDFDHGTDYFTVIEGNSGGYNCYDSTVRRTTYYNEDYFFTAFFRPNYGESVTQNDSSDTSRENCPTSGTRYRVRTHEFGWHDWMEGLHDMGGSSDDFAGSEGCWLYGFECEAHDYRIVRCDGSESVNAQGNEDSAVCGIEIMGDVDYQVHWQGSEPGWGKWEHGSDDNGAGKDENHPLDMIRVR